MSKKCVICGQEINPNDNNIPYKGRYAHEGCFNQTIKFLKTDKDKKLKDKQNESKANKSDSSKQKISKAKAELKDALSEEEYAEKKQYYDYIREILDIQKSERLPAKIYVLSENYIGKYGFTWIGMRIALQYICEVERKIITDNILGLLPYYYSKAETYYEDIKAAIDSNSTVNIDNMYCNKFVYIKKKKKEDLYDISSI